MNSTARIDFVRLLALEQELQRAANLFELVHCVSAEVRAVLGYQRVWLIVLDPADPTLARLVETNGEHTAPIRRHAALLPTSGDPLLEELLRNRGCVVVHDARTDPRTNKALVEKLGSRTIVGVPITRAGVTLGCLGTGSFAPEPCRTPRQAEVDYLIALAGRVALAVERLADATEHPGAMPGAEGRTRATRGARAAPAELCEIDLAATVERTVRTLGHLIGERILLTIERGEGSTLIEANESTLAPLIADLALEGCAALPDGGWVSLSIRRVARAAPSTSTAAPAKLREYVVLRVRHRPGDLTRPGAPRVPAEPGRDDGKLANSVRSVVASLGGFVEVEAANGAGADVLVHFPAAEPSLPEAERSTVVRSPSGWETVLVVEDDGATRSFVAEVLRGSGYTVFEAADGAQALRLLADCPQPIDLLLSDVVMPGMSGPELARRMKTVNPRLRVLFMSGYSGSRGPHETHSIAPNRLLAKPFTGSDLVRRVRIVLDRPERRS